MISIAHYIAFVTTDNQEHINRQISRTNNRM